MRIRSIGVISMVAALALLGGAGTSVQAKGHNHAKCCKGSKHSCAGNYCCKRKSNDAGAVMHKRGNFTTELEMMKAGGQCHVVCGKGPVTIFAPTDAAYKKLGQARLDALKKDPKKLAQYHIVNKKVMAGDIKPASSVQTAEGEHLMTNVKDGKASVDGCLIIEQDIPVSNGVLHILDEVPIPERGK